MSAESQKILPANIVARGSRPALNLLFLLLLQPIDFFDRVVVNFLDGFLETFLLVFAEEFERGGLLFHRVDGFFASAADANFRSLAEFLRHFDDFFASVGVHLWERDYDAGFVFLRAEF